MVDIAGYAALPIVPTFDDFERRLNAGVSGSLQQAGSIGGQAYGTSAGRSVGSSFASAAKKGILAAGVGILAAGAAAIKLGSDAYAEAIDAQKVGRLTNSVIRATGGAANTTAEQVGDLAERLSNMSAIDDEVIQTGANLLLTFKNVRNEAGKGNKIFDQATRAALNLSAAGFGSLDGAAKMVGKTLNDPVKGIAALSKAGVTFTEEQKKKIASLVEENDLLSAQKIILGEVESQVGGAARSQATLGGKIDVAWGNIQERLGTALLPMIRDVQRAILRDGVPAVESLVGAFENKGIPAIRRFGDWFSNEGAPAIGDFLDDMRPLAEEVIPAVGSALGTVRDFLGEAAPYAKDLVGAFNDAPDWMKTAIVGGGAGLLALNKLSNVTPGGKKGGLTGLLGSTKPVPVFVTNKGFSPATSTAGTAAAAGGRAATARAIAAGAALRAGPLVVPALGNYAAMNAIPQDERNSAAPAAGGYAGDAGAVAPPGTDMNTLHDPIGLRKLLGGKPYQVPAELDFGASGPEDLQRLLNPSNYPDSSQITAPLRDSLTRTNKFADDLRQGLVETGRTRVDPRFTTPGAEESRRKAVDLLVKYEAAGRPVSTSFHVDTSAAQARVAALRADIEAALNALNPFRNKGGDGGGSSGGDERRAAQRSTNSPVIPLQPQGRRQQVIVQIDGRDFAGYIDERIGADRDLRP